MKTIVTMLTISLAAGMAIAQTQQPQQSAQPDSKTAGQSETKNSSAAGTTAPAEMKTSTFKGTLMDMSCASQGSGSAPAAADQKNTANREAGSGSDCPVSANSSQFGMKMDDGKTVKFDMVGNQRTQDMIKNDKGWNKEITANKPIHAKVNGVLNGDKLIVSSIH
ncbi:MAG: hypothetical protein P4L56_00775 [Candidatus Sulfopaludibacter sp.]|nr:hypothetical protein [Candidatus Sulfopaludibacter sp.]